MQLSGRTQLVFKHEAFTSQEPYVASSSQLKKKTYLGYILSSREISLQA